MGERKRREMGNLDAALFQAKTALLPRWISAF
jgi:hypothetical protein